MKTEFPLEFEEFFVGGLSELRKTIIVQMAAIDHYLNLEKKGSHKHSKFRRILTNKEINQMSVTEVKEYCEQNIK